MKDLKSTVTELTTDTEPTAKIYHVLLEEQASEDEEHGVWEETFTTSDQLRAFLRGIKAAYAMSGGHFPEVELPHSAYEQFGGIPSKKDSVTVKEVTTLTVEDILKAMDSEHGKAIIRRVIKGEE